MAYVSDWPRFDRTIWKLQRMRPNRRRKVARHLPWSRMTEEQRATVIKTLNVGSRWQTTEALCGYRPERWSPSYSSYR